MPETFQVRRASLPDRTVLADLWTAFFNEQAEMDTRFDAAEDARERWVNDFPFWLADETRRIFVASHPEQVVGFAAAHQWFPPPIYKASSEVYIDGLYIAPESRRQGAGSLLVHAIQQWAEGLGVERLRVDVLAQGQDSLAFWQSRHAKPLALTLTIELTEAAPRPQRRHAGKFGF